MERRRFLKLSTSVAAAALAGPVPHLPAQEKRKPLGVILYTLRDAMKADFEGTLTRVAGIGYPAVEFAGYYGRSAADIRALLDRLELQCCGAHEGIGGLESDAAARCAFVQALGGRHLTVPSLPGDVRKQGHDGYRAFGERLSKAGEKVAAEGCVLAYHNHAFEFQMVDGTSLYESMLETADPRFVKLQLDVYWAFSAGLDPAAFIRKVGKRFATLHMKDMPENGKGFAPVGTGKLDTAGIVAAGREVGVEWYIVEQDRCEGSPFDAVATSFANLQALL
ncbi:MAG: sugar phosphate isomerase/epimerase [Lentisphaeria bacterium]|nr:sugar phosphate isomerase/epimerase [Lentisphaeria bacterium]